MGMSYAMAYPFGICGILLTMWLVRLFFRINVEKEAQRFEESSGNGHAHLHTINVRVENPNLNQMAIQDVPMLNNDNIVCSRLKRGELLMVPAPGTLIQAGDLLHLVGRPEDLHNAQLVIGQEVATSLSTRGTDLKVERVVVTNEKVLGKKIRDLHVKQRYDVVISRLNRAGVELVASSSASLQFGDILNLVGRPEAIDAVAAELVTLSRSCSRSRCCRCLSASDSGYCWIYPVVYSRLPCRIEAGTGRWAADYGADPWAYRQYRQAVLVYAAERQPGAARAGDSAVSGGGRAKIGGVTLSPP
ncbi:mediator of hyperadherence YidE [Klebsiella pneumoniae]|uniref:Mediator of hyperadherence YidE n=1 Tax=Klebsiella pneumoniae TaxID=573 RepID=A0A377TH49_KLEPN|nr:mediator of hyperadherence YidE [Klebsiella pneumoniae]